MRLFIYSCVNNCFWRRKKTLFHHLNYLHYPGFMSRPVLCTLQLTSQVSETRCSLEKRPSLFDVFFGLCLSKICMSSDRNSAAIKIVNQVSLEVKPGEAGDLPGKVLQREELKLCALVPGSL